jgi:HEPN domain-containing protein
VDYAENSWGAANLTLAQYPSDAAYSFSQAAEKYLKALLFYRRQAVPYSHDLAQLLQVALPDADLKLQQAAALLNIATSRSRYPNELEPPDSVEAKKFAEAAALIRQAVRDLLQLEDMP